MEEDLAKSEVDFKVPLLVSKVNANDLPPPKLDKKQDKSQKPTGTDSTLSNQNVILPYKEPAWSDSPPENYSFEVIKSGVILSNFDIRKSYTVVGRLTTCDITLEHPSVSRYHAVLQYCGGTDVYPKGLYVYDLGSTHGTFLNKEQIKANIYYLVKCGHVVKFGGSTRLHILNCPEYEEAPVKEVSAEVVSAVPKIDGLCSWGIGEDAEEEDDLSVNPFAILTENESLYIDDPKKTLKGWFEREGYELEYSVEEKGLRTFSCTVRLPIDTPTGEFLAVEAAVNGKKKEAVVACALEACRTLDRHGLLRQSNQSSRERKRKNWEDEDFYDSDDDTYLDRTGAIEKKRQIRMKHVKKSEPETYDSLQKKLEELNKKIFSVEEKLQSNASSNSSGTRPDEDDPLDSYMCAITQEAKTVDKVTKSKLKLDLADLTKEKSKLEKLLKISKPTELPIKKFPTMIGKRLKSKIKLPVSQPVVKKIPKNDDPDVEEEEEEEEDVVQDKQTETNVLKMEKTSDITPSPVCTNKPENDSAKIKIDLLETCESPLPALKPQEKETIKHSTPPATTSSRNARKSRPTKTDKKDIYKTVDENYSMWMPPDNQKGDGTTHLNSKFGY